MALPFKGNLRKYAPFSDFFLKKRGAAQQILKNANPTLSQNIFHLSGGFAFWNFQEKRNGILAILVQKPENPLET